ncbi:MAG TPA: hypothetical protein VK204_19535 [Nocardioidaceae bacterium]|nr:hypothetical protein [Nocardioidaceae bacterium]
MTAAWERRGIRVLLVLAVALGTAAATAALGPSAQSEPSWQVRRNVDLTGSALAGRGDLHAVDAAYRAVRVPYRRVKADTTANASATCDGCSADATALQILYLDGESGSTVDNVAAAWSRCRGCRATALSVQVVVVRGRPSIQANNRALAVNAACRHCHTASAAFQVVVAGERGPRFTSADRRKLRRWVAEQAMILRVDDSGPASRRAAGGHASRRAQLRELDRIVNGALGTTTLQRRAQLRRW